MLSHQSFSIWQQSPIQGTVPSIPSDESHLEIVTDALLDAIDRLTFAHHILENTGLDKSHTALFTAVCDALNGTNEAIERSSDSPDENPISDTDLEALNPFGDLTHE
jgi:hypothetical protein